MIDLIPVAVALPDTAPAPAVIVVHGQGASKERWLGELSHYAAAGVIGVAVDARAHGSRAVDDIDTSGAIPVLDFLDIVDGTADDIAEVIDSLASMPGWNGRVAVWGFSMGAAIALLAAVRDPRVGAVALVGLPLLESDPDPADYPISDPDPEVLRELARRTAAGQLAAGIGARPVLFAHGSLDDDYHRVCGLFGAMADTGARAVMLAYNGGHHPPAEVLDTVRDWTVGALLR